MKFIWRSRGLGLLVMNKKPKGSWLKSMGADPESVLFCDDMEDSFLEKMLLGSYYLRS